MPHYVARNDSPGRGDRPRARPLVTLTLVAMAMAAALGAAPASAASRGPDSPADAPRAATPLGGIASKATRAGSGATQEIYDPATRKVTLKVDSGFDLDQYLSASSNPLDFQLDLHGFEAPAGESVPLTLRVYDVDQNGAPGFDECAVEVDRVSVNGTPVGQLSGANDQWSIVTMNVPAGVLNDGVNNVSIQIDVLTGDCWAVQVDWASLVLPTHIRHVRTDARDDVTIRRGRTDAVIGDTIYKRQFRTDGTLTDPDPDDPIADEFKGAGSFTYRYALDAWPEKPRWAPNVKITWDIKGSGTRSGLIEQTGWENQFRVNLPKKVGKYTLEVTMIILHEDAPFMTEVVKHDLYVVYDKPTGPTQDSFGDRARDAAAAHRVARRRDRMGAGAQHRHRDPQRAQRERVRRRPQPARLALRLRSTRSPSRSSSSRTATTATTTAAPSATSGGSSPRRSGSRRSRTRTSRRSAS